MGTLASELFKNGLASETAVKQKEEQERNEAAREVPKKWKPTGGSLMQLEAADSVGEFKRIAKLLLQEDESLIREIISQSHRFVGKPGGKKLIWLLYQVRDGLRELSPARHQELLDRSFRKAGATPTVSDTTIKDTTE